MKTLKTKFIYAVSATYTSDEKNYNEGTVILRAFTDEKLAKKYSKDIKIEILKQLDKCVNLDIEVNKVLLS
jgi:hypothetical protein